MNYKSLVGFKIILFFLLISFSEASDNHISIDPVGLGQDGLYEITISGERFADECLVAETGYEIGRPPRDLLIFGGSHVLILKVSIIERSPSSEKCNFTTTMVAYLPPAIYNVGLLTSNGGPLEVATFTSNLEGNRYFQVEMSPLPIDIQKVNAEISAPDSFTLRNILVPGYEDTYWGEFKWNPDRLSFDLENAGID